MSIEQNTINYRRMGVILAVFLLLLAACATPAPRVDDIAARAQARWDLLLSGDMHGAYQYLSPGYRSSVSSQAYQRKLLLQKVRWRGAKFIESDCSESLCKVQISLDYVLVAAVPGLPRYDGTQTVQEDWVKAAGQWWFVPEK